MSVSNPPKISHVVEFSITTGAIFKDVEHSATKKRRFIELLREVFRDQDTSAISMSVSNPGEDKTMFTWRNLSLRTDLCPHEEIKNLETYLVTERSTNPRLEKIMTPEFPVLQVNVDPMGKCLGSVTVVNSPDVASIDDASTFGVATDEYLYTFLLPVVIVATMILLAAIIACVLYRRRRSGKMSITARDEEKQCFRNKGIPVIFQDELDEKPDPGKKSFQRPLQFRLFVQK